MTVTVSEKVTSHVSSLEMTEIPVKLMQETIFFEIRGCDLGSPNAEKITWYLCKLNRSIFLLDFVSLNPY